MDKLYTIEEAADILNLSAGTLRNWRSQGIGVKSIKVMGSVRYRPEDIQEYIDNTNKGEEESE